MRFAPANTAGRLLSEITGNPASLTIRIVDYPGEWLLDLPLLGQSYAEWSRATLHLLRKGVRAEIGSDFLAFVEQHRPNEVASEEVAKQAHDLYRAYLVNARDQPRPELPAAGPFLCRAVARRRALSVVRAARCAEGTACLRRTRSAR